MHFLLPAHSIVSRWTRLAALSLIFVSSQINAHAQSSAARESPTVIEQVQNAYRFGDFAEQERLYAVNGKAGLRSESTGLTRLGQFWRGIGKVSDSELNVSSDYYLQLELLTARWTAEHPDSVLAHLLHADALRAHAWVYRGAGFAKTVSPAAMVDFQAGLDRALAALERARPLAAKDSAWNNLMLTVGRGKGWDRRRLLAVFEEGIAKNPDDDDLYFSMQTALLPKWGGDLETVDRFISLAVKNTREKRGLEMYTRLYAAAADEEFDQSLFTVSRASWSTMKLGFEELLKRYPNNGRRNSFAYFACMADDRVVLQEQLRSIANHFDREFWGSHPERTFEACQRTAQRV